MGTGARVVALGLFILIICSWIVPAHSADSPSDVLDKLKISKKIHVILMGFDGTGAYVINPQSFQQLLTYSFPSHQPSFQDTHAYVDFPFALQFQVTRADAALRERYERALAREIVKTLPTDPALWGQGVEVAMTAELSQLLDLLYSSHVREEQGVALLLLQPNVRTAVAELARTRDAESLRYWYRTEGGGPTHAWIAGSRYAVLDTAAGPVRFGASHVADGLAEWNRAAALPSQLDARLAALVLSAVRHVFVPDVRFARLRTADRLLVPVLVFRDHNQTNPLTLLDSAALKQAMLGLAAPGQDVRMFTGLHHLHEHPHLAAAVARARRADSLHQLDLLGRFAARTQPYLDTALLHEALVRAADPLAAQLLRSVAPHLASSFFPEAGGPRSQNVRILPVYVLSLSNAGAGAEEAPLLLDREGLVVALPDCVVVLHSPATTLRVPFFHDGRPVHVDPAGLTRHVLAGLAQALAGLVPPTARYSPQHERPVADLTWANGWHPFGPFSNSSQLSPLFTDLVMRNYALSSVHQALEVARRKMDDVNAFALTYLYDPFGEEVATAEPSDWLDFVYHAGGESRGPLSRQAVARLHDEMERLAAAASALTEQLGGASQEQQLAAYRAAVSFGRLAEVFRQYVDENLRTAERELLCCALQHSVSSNRQQLNPTMPVFQRPLPLVLFALLLVAAAGGYAFWRKLQLRNFVGRPRKRYSPTLY